ncbi:MAG: ComEC/Rec2 family competence protein [Saprospiraceae bacterium]
MSRLKILHFTFFILHVAVDLSAQNTTQLPPWQEGFFDLHHISTGRGNAAYLVFPDGTTMLIDAGDISDTHPRTLSPRNSSRKPNASRSTGAWIADYIRQFAPANRPQVLDYAMITHYHDDHFGEWDETRPTAKNGAYKLTGIVEVGDQIPIKTLIDRGFDFPIDLKNKDFQERAARDEYHIVQTLQEYWKFIAYHQQNSGLKNEVLQSGSNQQITLLKNPTNYPDFQVRNISVNGRVWTGFKDGETLELFKNGQYPGENPLSTCIKISYGKFDYFTGGDISGVNGWGEADFNSVEANIAPVVGAVDVATLNHHGNRDSQSAYYVRTLRPRVWVQQLWSSDHPGEEVLRRITSQNLYPGERDLFATDMLESNELVIGEKIANSYKSRHGHVVIRVYEKGLKYKVFILNDESEKREVIGAFGPYESR